jgi:sec-independent protein translocase protein TatC
VPTHIEPRPYEPLSVDPPEESRPDDRPMSILEHLQELRRRLRNAAIAFTLGMVVGFVLVKQSFGILVAPMVRGIERAGFAAVLQAAGPTEGFWVSLKLALVLGLGGSAPFVFWELWKFVAPALYRKERRMALLVVIGTGVCFVGGAVFGHQVLAEPSGYVLTKMLADFSSEAVQIKPEYNLEEVTNFLALTLLGSAASFELPVVLVLMGALGVVSAGGLWRFNKYALVLSALAGAVLTPGTDPFAQLMLAGPLYALYNVSILVVWLIERARRRRAGHAGMAV